MANLPIAILAGGLATRLGSITAKTPKILLEVAGEPFLSHQLRLIKGSGLTKVVLCLGHLGRSVEEKYGSGLEWGLQIKYSFDGEMQLGTGGALIKALPLLGEAFYVIYGDSYLPIDFRSVGNFFLKSSKPGLMTVFNNNSAFDRSNVLFEDGIIKKYSKNEECKNMRHID
jgi:NDP-sugar pyrophosphorylase family protein